MRFAKYAVAIALLAGTALAQQGPPMKGRRAAGVEQAGPARQQAFQALVDYLKLTEQQQSELRTLLASRHEAVQPLAQQLRTKNQALRQAIKQDPVQPAAVTQLRNEIRELREKMKAEHLSFGEKARQVLTGEQVGLLNALQEALSLGQAARQAAWLGLIDPPEGAGGPGFGPMGGPGMRRN